MMGAVLSTKFGENIFSSGRASRYALSYVSQATLSSPVVTKKIM